MEIEESARKHGVSDEDMLHAVRQYSRRLPQDGETWMYIGPTRSGHGVLEVAVVDDDQGQRIIHAMKARPKYLH